MIGAHPGGTALTRRLLELAAAKPPARILDLGAGTGESVDFLRQQGFEADGIDRTAFLPRGKVMAGDMRALSFPDASYDLCMAECSISVCGDGPAALREIFRVLGPGGSLLLSDVFFKKEEAPYLSMPEPLTLGCWERESIRAGFIIRAVRDESPLWREFFIQSLWNDNADGAFCEFFREAGKAGCGYFLAWLEKGGGNGSV